MRNPVINDTAVVSCDFISRRKVILGCGGWVRGCKKISGKEKEPSQSVSQSINLYPNPMRAGNSMTVELNRSSEHNLSLTIYSATGQLLRRSAYQAMKGDNQITLETNPTWTPGMYFIEIKEAGSSAAIKTKFIIQ